MPHWLRFIGAVEFRIALQPERFNSARSADRSRKRAAIPKIMTLIKKSTGYTKTLHEDNLRQIEEELVGR